MHCLKNMQNTYKNVEIAENIEFVAKKALTKVFFMQVLGETTKVRIGNFGHINK